MYDCGLETHDLIVGKFQREATPCQQFHVTWGNYLRDLENTREKCWIGFSHTSEAEIGSKQPPDVRMETVIIP